MKIDKTKPVMVTGATGYVAGWLVKRLLEDGITVHAAVRNPDNKHKTQHLDKLASELPGNIKYFKSDLMQEGSYAEAMEGCELVFHTASPYTLDVKDPQKELIEPALNGTKNVIEQANKTESVKRVVLTSSCAAIYTDANETAKAPNGELTEEIWNTTASLDYQPYSYSKTLAEKAAWNIAGKQDRWDPSCDESSRDIWTILESSSYNFREFQFDETIGGWNNEVRCPKLWNRIS